MAKGKKPKVKRPYGYGRIGAAEWLRRVDQLEKHFGSQRALAGRLGVSPSTLRKWQYYQSTPRPEAIKKVNRIYSQIERTKTKKKQAQVMGIRQWMEKYHPDMDEHVRTRISAEVANRGLAYAVYYIDQADESQFITFDQYEQAFILGNTSIIGKPKSLRSLTIVGSVTLYQTQHSKIDMKLYQQSLHDYMLDQWSLIQTLSFARQKFFEAGTKGITAQFDNKDRPYQFYAYYTKAGV